MSIKERVVFLTFDHSDVSLEQLAQSKVNKIQEVIDNLPPYATVFQVSETVVLTNGNQDRLSQYNRSIIKQGTIVMIYYRAPD